MGILADAMRRMNGGKGVRVLTDKGEEHFNRMVREEKRKRGIHWNKNCSGEQWYKDLKNSLFKDEYEWIYWNYCYIEK